MAAGVSSSMSDETLEVSSDSSEEEDMLDGRDKSFGGGWKRHATRVRAQERKSKFKSEQANTTGKPLGKCRISHCSSTLVQNP